MKKMLFFLLSASHPAVVFSQNVGIGIAKPSNKLQVAGNLLVQELGVSTTKAPTAAQHVTMTNGTTTYFAPTDSTGRIYDPGGPAGNYLANLTAATNIEFYTEEYIPNPEPGMPDIPTLIYYGLGVEITIENINLGLGDSLIITDILTGTRFFAAGGKYTTPGQIVVNSNRIKIQFKSNADALVGAGFSLLYKMLFVSASPTPIAGVAGKGFYFDASNGALRSGVTNNSGRGNNSIALGESNEAAGNAATALGYFNKAPGTYSTALGAYGEANNIGTATIGYNNTAGGAHAKALGSNNTVSGNYSSAFGNNNFVSGDYATAMGNSIRVSGDGSFAIGDNSSVSVINFGTANRMIMRFANGYNLYTSADRSTGVYVGGGGNSWASLSDSTKKENYLPANGNTFLAKIGGMKLGSWNYKGQNKKTFRHYGPMAQEFFTHFGNDGIGTVGNDTTIASADIDGVIMIAIQALIKENEALREANKTIEARLQKLEAVLGKQHIVSKQIN